MIRLGGTNLSKIMVGTTSISKVMLGSNLLWELAGAVVDLITQFTERVTDDGGTYMENDMSTEIVEEEGVTLLLTPNAYKAGKLYSAIPEDGSGDFNVGEPSNGNKIRENICPWSEDFSQAPYIYNFPTVSTNTDIAPDGTLTADTITHDPNNNSNIGWYSEESWTVGEVFYFSIYVKDITTEIFIASTAHFNQEFSYEDVGDGWYRHIYKHTTIQNHTAKTRAVISKAAHPGPVTVWGLQIEKDTLTDYTKTEGTAIAEYEEVYTELPVIEYDIFHEIITPENLFPNSRDLSPSRETTLIQSGLTPPPGVTKVWEITAISNWSINVTAPMWISVFANTNNINLVAMESGGNGIYPSNKVVEDIGGGWYKHSSDTTWNMNAVRIQNGGGTWPVVIGGWQISTDPIVKVDSFIETTGTAITPSEYNELKINSRIINGLHNLTDITKVVPRGLTVTTKSTLTRPFSGDYLEINRPSTGAYSSYIDIGFDPDKLYTLIYYTRSTSSYNVIGTYHTISNISTYNQFGTYTTKSVGDGWYQFTHVGQVSNSNQRYLSIRGEYGAANTKYLGGLMLLEGDHSGINPEHVVAYDEYVSLYPITTTPPAGTQAIIETVDGVDTTITSIPTTYQLSVGNVNKVKMLNYIPIDPDYQAVLDFATSQGITLPDETQQEIDNQLLIDYKATGGWDRDDVFAKFTGTADPAFKLIDWKRLSQFSVVGTVTWSVDGVKGNGTTGFIKTGWTPSVDASNYTLTDGSVIYTQTGWVISSAAQAIYGAMGSNSASLVNFGTSTYTYAYFNGGYTDGETRWTFPFYPKEGFNSVSRVESSITARFATTRTGTQTPVALPNKELRLLAYQHAGVDNETMYGFNGSSTLKMIAVGSNKEDIITELETLLTPL